MRISDWSSDVCSSDLTIKSHHNVGGLPARMNMKLVEPLRELFKDEVRALGRELGLPGAFVGRHPFPGPGLAIRIPGAITAEDRKSVVSGKSVSVRGNRGGRRIIKKKKKQTKKI